MKTFDGTSRGVVSGVREMSSVQIGATGPGMKTWWVEAATVCIWGADEMGCDGADAVGVQSVGSVRWRGMSVSWFFWGWLWVTDVDVPPILLRRTFSPPATGGSATLDMFFKQGGYPLVPPARRLRLPALSVFGDGVLAGERGRVCFALSGNGSSGGGGGVRGFDATGVWARGEFGGGAWGWRG